MSPRGDKKAEEDPVVVPPKDRQSIFEKKELKRSTNDFDMLKVWRAAKKCDNSRFLCVQVLGKGAFGKVLLVRDKLTKAIYAMKMLHKSVILERQQVCLAGFFPCNLVYCIGLFVEPKDGLASFRLFEVLSPFLFNVTD